MSAKEMYDYLEEVTPDNEQTLEVKPQRTYIETGTKAQVIHKGDDGSEERIDFGTDNVTIFYVTLSFDVLTESDSGTIFEFWNASTYGGGIAKTFWWLNYAEPSASRHTYTVRFDCDLNRAVRIGAIYGFTDIRLAVVGKKLDA